MFLCVGIRVTHHYAWPLVSYLVKYPDHTTQSPCHHLYLVKIFVKNLKGKREDPVGNGQTILCLCHYISLYQSGWQGV